MAHDVMISYSPENIEIVKSICYLLEQKGIKSWYAKREISPAESFPAQCVEAIENCRIMSLIFSSYSNESKHLCPILYPPANNIIPLDAKLHGGRFR